MHKFTPVAAPLSCVALAGCTPLPPLVTGPAATLNVHIKNDVGGRFLSRSGTADAFANPQCERGRQVANNNSMPNDGVLPPVQIPAGAPFTFAAALMNYHVFQGFAGCTVTLTFVPEVGVSYQARLTGRDDARRCDMVITNDAGAEVPATSNEYSCHYTFAGNVRSGFGWTKDLLDRTTFYNEDSFKD